MARATTVHVCSECGVSSAQWRGQCPGCGAWNTLVEERVAPAPRGRGRGAGTPGPGGSGPSQVRLLGEVGASPLARLLDRYGRARPRARRGPGPRLAGAARRGPRDRQVDAHEHGARPPRARRCEHPVRQRRGVGRAGQAAGRAPGRRGRRLRLRRGRPPERAARAGAGRDRARAGARGAPRAPPAGVCDRLGPDPRVCGAGRGARDGGPGPGGRRQAAARWPRSRPPR